MPNQNGEQSRMAELPEEAVARLQRWFDQYDADKILDQIRQIETQAGNTHPNGKTNGNGHGHGKANDPQHETAKTGKTRKSADKKPKAKAKGKTTTARKTRTRRKPTKAAAKTGG